MVQAKLNTFAAGEALRLPIAVRRYLSNAHRLLFVVAAQNRIGDRRRHVIGRRLHRIRREMRISRRRPHLRMPEELADHR